MPAQSMYFGDGQQVQATDLNTLGEASLMSGEAIAAIIGVSDANADDVPLTVTPGAGLAVVVGGTGQKVLVQNNLADYIPAQSYPLAAAGGADRYDLVAFAYADVLVPSGGSAYFMDPSGSIGDPQPTSFVYRGINVSIVTGTPGAGLPGAPSGFDPLAQVLVPAGSTAVTPAQITMLLPTIASIIGAIGSGGVSSLNGESGALSLVPGSPNVTITPSGSSIAIAVVASGGGIVTIVADSTNVVITDHGGGSIGIAVVTNAALSGIAYFGFYVNYGTDQTGIAGTTDFGTCASVLGSLVLPIIGGSGASGGTAAARFRVKVAAGAGAQTVYGQVPIPVAGGTVTARMFVDNVEKANSSGVTLAWSATFSDDGAFHTLTLHIETSVGASIASLWSAWIPATPTGGIDTTKFSYIGV